MGADAYNQLFALLEPSEVVTAGNAQIVYTQRGTLWASMEWLGATEAGVTAATSWRFKSHYRGDLKITSRWRLGLVGTTRKFELTSPAVDPDGRRRDLAFTGVEIQA